MITYEEAKKTALKIDKFDLALDYGDVFVFGYKNNNTLGDEPLVVRKSDGALQMFSDYIMSRKEHISPKAMPI